MNEVNEKRMEQIKAVIYGKVSEKKGELAEKWLADMKYCMEHMDEAEYGCEFLSHVEWALGMTDKKPREMEDRVVVNTLALMAGRLNTILGVKRNRLHDLQLNGVRETLTPDGRWMWRGYHSHVRRTQHGYRVEFSARKGVNPLPTPSPIMGKEPATRGEEWAQELINMIRTLN